PSSCGKTTSIGLSKGKDKERTDMSAGSRRWKMVVQRVAHMGVFIVLAASCGAAPAAVSTSLPTASVHITPAASRVVLLPTRAATPTLQPIATVRRATPTLPVPCILPSGWSAHAVMPGDTIADLAARAGVAVEQVR